MAEFGTGLTAETEGRTIRIEVYRGGASTQFGDPGDIPVPGDYDGDGQAEFAVFRPSTGVWYILGASQFIQYGEPSHDKQVVRIGGVQ